MVYLLRMFSGSREFIGIVAGDELLGSFVC